MSGKYPVSEIFTSIQGEGNYAGVRSLFIRFQLCNLKCTWCDTKYTWLKSTGKFKWYTATELKKIIVDSGVFHVIFTGGEPAFQLLDKLIVPNTKFHVETNATIVPDKPLKTSLRDGDIIERPAMDTKIISQFNWVVSPKLSNSKQEVNWQALGYWSKQSFCIFKFIVCNTNDLKEISDLVKKLGITLDKVYVGIEGISAETQLQPQLVEQIIEYKFNYSPRLHTLLWGAQQQK